VNFYRAPLSFLSAPKYQDSRDLVPLHALTGCRTEPAAFHEPMGLALR
jgi:hypothetical protein